MVCSLLHVVLYGCNVANSKYLRPPGILLLSLALVFHSISPQYVGVNGIMMLFLSLC